MAEMKWLASDFLEERKRFAKKRKELNKAILSISKMKEQAEERKRQVFRASFVLWVRNW